MRESAPQALAGVRELTPGPSALFLFPMFHAICHKKLSSALCLGMAVQIYWLPCEEWDPENQRQLPGAGAGVVSADAGCLDELRLRA